MGRLLKFSQRSNNKRTDNQRGAVALLTTIIIGILLIIIVTSMVYLMIGELRQATDTDQSARAYVLAQSRAEDIAFDIRRRLFLAAQGLPVKILDSTDQE